MLICYFLNEKNKKAILVMFESLSMSYLDHARFDGMSLYASTAQHVIKLG